MTRVVCGAGLAAVAKPLGKAEGEEQSAEGQAHEGDNESEPSGVGACAEARVAAEEGDEEKHAEQACCDHRTAPLEELAGAVIGWGGCVFRRARGHGVSPMLIERLGSYARCAG